MQLCVIFSKQVLDSMWKCFKKLPFQIANQICFLTLGCTQAVHCWIHQQLVSVFIHCPIAFHSSARGPSDLMVRASDQYSELRSWLPIPAGSLIFSVIYFSLSQHKNLSTNCCHQYITSNLYTAPPLVHTASRCLEFHPFLTPNVTIIQK